jgi:putative FmdB family regulatory protein
MTYEYECQACGHQWEAEQSIKDSPLKRCASCGKDKAKRLVSGGTGFLLKGGGWYADGYGSAGASKPSDKAETKSEGSKPADAKADTKSGGESKPAADSAPAADTKPSSPAPSPASSVKAS